MYFTVLLAFFFHLVVIKYRKWYNTRLVALTVNPHFFVARSPIRELRLRSAITSRFFGGREVMVHFYSRRYGLVKIKSRKQKKMQLQLFQLQRA